MWDSNVIPFYSTFSVHSIDCQRSGKYYIFSILVNIENLEANSGFSQRHWTVTSDFDFTSPDAESISYNPPNGTSAITNILPYSFKTSPDTVYRVQGYWRPYFDGWYNFSVNSDLLYEIIVEQDNRTIKFCSGEQTWYVLEIKILILFHT